MGIHRDKWAIEVIRQIKDIGERLGYVTVEEEKKIIRGWLDICWKWNIPSEDSVYLLIAEVESSKSDWPRVRNNAAKAVELKPTIYAHIFHPSVKLTDEERSQLAAIHHGNHVHIVDGTSKMPLPFFLHQLAAYDQQHVRSKFSLGEKITNKPVVPLMPDSESWILEFKDGSRIQMPLLALFRDKLVPCIAIDFGNFRVGAAISTIHTRTWINSQYAALAGIDIAKGEKRIKSFLFSRQNFAKVFYTDQLGFMGKKITQEVVVSDAFPDSMPPIVGQEFLRKIGASIVSVSIGQIR